MAFNGKNHYQLFDDLEASEDPSSLLSGQQLGQIVVAAVGGLMSIMPQRVIQLKSQEPEIGQVVRPRTK